MVVGLGWNEVHAPGQAKVVSQASNPPLFREAVGATGPAHHHQSSIRTTQSGQACHSDVEAFERLDPAHKRQYRSVVETGDSAGHGAGARREVGVVDARGDDLDPRRLGAVVVDQLTRLLGAAGQDHVGAPDDLGLGLDSALGFQVTGLGLDPGQGVEGGGQREVELVLEAVPSHAAQPVVG